MVAVSAPASFVGAVRWPTAFKTLKNSRSRLNGATEPSVWRTTRLLLRSADSMLVKMAPHLLHSRRRQTCCRRFCGLELVTCVGLAQYIHTMSTY